MSPSPAIKAGVVLGIALWAAANLSLTAQRPAASPAVSGGLEVLQLRSNFFMISGAGGHIAVQTGDDGVVLVDAGLFDRSIELGSVASAFESMCVFSRSR